tara:strand:- start:371 stop:517 length:147 start_codon:yes stop_codon:yes gene_type:complete
MMTREICQNCHGNGYVRVKYSLESDEEFFNCPVCNSEGTVETKAEEKK